MSCPTTNKFAHPPGDAQMSLFTPDNDRISQKDIPANSVERPRDQDMHHPRIAEKALIFGRLLSFESFG
jgi:hypothetical protein